MADNLGALSSYALTAQNMKVAMIKHDAEAQQAVVDILLEQTEASRNVSPSETVGRNVDVSI